MNINTHLGKYPLTLIRMTITKKPTNNEWWRECGEKGTLLHCWWECKLIAPLWRTLWRFLYKLGIKPPYDPTISLLGIYLEKTISEKDTCPSVHCSAVHSSQDMEAIYMFIDRWMGKKVLAHIHNRVLLSHEKEHIWVGSSEVEEPRACCTKWS